MSRSFKVQKGGPQSFKIFLQTSFVHVPLSRRRRNLLDLRDDRSVRSALFWKLYLPFVQVCWNWSSRYQTLSSTRGLWPQNQKPSQKLASSAGSTVSRRNCGNFMMTSRRWSIRRMKRQNRFVSCRKSRSPFLALLRLLWMYRLRYVIFFHSMCFFEKNYQKF